MNECTALEFDTTLTEADIVRGTQPIRQFAKAAAMYHFFASGVYELLFTHENWSGEELAAKLSLNPERTTAFLEYLRNEDLVELKKSRWSLNSESRALAPLKGWYTMFIGGYGDTFLKIGAGLKAGYGCLSRDGGAVGIGSGQIGRYDANPLMAKLLMELSTSTSLQILDLGCGSGSMLIDLCAHTPGVQTLGIDPDPVAISESRTQAELRGVAARATFAEGSFDSLMSRQLQEFKPKVIIFAFVLHELLAQRGEEGLASYVRELGRLFPQSRLAVIEVDKPEPEAPLAESGLSKSYYNPYFLLHKFTNQELRPKKFWNELFARSGYHVEKQLVTDSKIDSSGYEFGTLLRFDGAIT